MSSHSDKISASIPAEKLEPFMKEYLRLAKKFGDQISLAVSEPYMGDFTYYSKYDEYSVKIQVVDVEIVPTFYQISGWTFVGTIEDSVMYNRESFTIPESFRNYGNICDHCGYDRRRNKFLIFQNDSSGEYWQFGTSCAKDYFGHDIEMLLNSFGKFSAFVAEMSDEDWVEGCARSGSLHFSLETVVYNLLVVVERYGYISRRKAEEEFCLSTSDTVQDLIFGVGKVHDDCEGIKPKFEAAFFIEKVLEVFENDMGDFGRNVYHLYQQEDIPARSIGIVCGAYYAVQKQLENEPTEVDKLIQKFGKHYPNPNDKVSGIFYCRRSDNYPGFDGEMSTRYIGEIVSISGSDVLVTSVAFYIGHGRKNADEMLEKLDSGNPVSVSGTVRAYNSQYDNFGLARVKVM